METIKNLLHPGKAKDDEQLYGAGQSGEPTTTGTGHTSGEGSHFSGAKDTTTSNPISGTHNSNAANTTELSGTKGTGHVPHEPFSGEGKHLTSSTNTGATSGLTSHETSGVTSSHPTTSGQSHIGRDAAVGAGAGGLLGHETQKHQTTSGLGSSTGTSGVGNTQTSGLTSGSSNPYSSTSTTDPNTSRLAGTSGLPSSTMGTSSHMPGEWTEDNSNVGNTQHPSSNTTSGPHLGRDAAALGTAGGIGAGIHEHNQNQRELPVRANDDTASSSIAHPNTSQLGSNQGTTSATQGSSGHHLGRDAAIGGTALGGASLAAHEHNKNNDREFPLGSGTGASTGNSGLGHGTSHEASSGYSGLGVASGTSHHTGPTGSALQSSGPHSTDTANLLDPSVNRSGLPTEDAHHHDHISGGGAEEADKHHGARNAGVAAGALGAVGLGKHEHDKHQQSSTGATSGLGQTSSSDPTSSHGVGHSTTNPTSSSTTHPTSSTQHHTGRDAGVGASALGAAGLAKHEHDKHNTTSSTGHSSSTTHAQTSSTTTALPGPAPNTAGPHRHDILNKLDPRVKSNPDTTSTSKDDNGHHHGRDAAVAGGVGGAAYEADKHHKSHEAEKSQISPPGATTHPIKGVDAGAHSSNTDHHHGRDAAAVGGVGGAAYEADKHHKSHQAEKSQISPPGATTHPIKGVDTGTHSSDKDHHHGRDAATVGGAGALGAGAYEAKKHHDADKSQIGQHGSTTHATSGVGAGIHSNDPLKDYHYGSKPGPVEGSTTHPTDAREDHHHGRDAAAVGGVGAVGAGAYEANKHHDSKELEKEAKKEHKHEEKEAKKEAKHEHKEEKKSGGLLSFLHRDKSKKYTKEEEDEFDRQEKEHHSRNAALGAGAVGAGGVGAYEANKHHNSHEAGATGLGAGEKHSTLGDHSTSTTGQHHTGRDAALGAGAVGAAGTGAHEHNKHATPLAEKPVGTDIGDKLHGVERNRGVPGSSGLPGTAGYGAGAGASGVHSEASTDRSGHPIGTGSSTTGTGHTTGTSHLGRDAAIGGAGLGGAGIAAHEHNKHDSGYTASTEQGKTTSTTPSTTGIYEGKTSSTAASSGLAHEDNYRKQDTTSGLTGTGHSATGQSGTGEYDPFSTAKQPSVLESGVGSEASGRNRLHKDPPSSHPAAQSGSSHVPTSGNDRGNMVQEGEQKIGNNTGVHNANETNY